MQKKYIIAIVVAAFLWGGFMFYRHHKNQGGQTHHRDKLNAQLVEMAKKSPRAGLTHIGEALSAYYKENNRYPARLMDLYPKFLDNKAFLQEIEWHYEPRGVDFYLSKTIVMGDRRMVASMDNSMRPKAERSVMVAAPTAPPKTTTLQERDKKTEKVEIASAERLEMARENFFNALREGRFTVSAISLPDEDEAQLFSKVMPQVTAETEADGLSEMESELSSRYLVWKGDNGSYGFSNTQYPDAERLSVFAFGRWFHIQVPPLAVPTAPGDKPEGGDGSMDPMVASLADNLLVWKDRLGTLGFGNLQYPEKTLASVFETGEWVTVDNGRPPSPSAPTAIVAPEQQTELAPLFAQQWLVWKDEKGILGFGNLQYPGKHAASVYQDDGWTQLEDRPLAETPDGEPGSETTGRNPADAIASTVGTSCLVWKDKGGTLGFGNLQYPEQDLAAVFQTDEWVSVERRPVPAEKTEETAPREEQGSVETAEAVDSMLGGPYLVWKTERGTLGFGDGQYPGGVSVIRVDGTWQPVAN